MRTFAALIFGAIVLLSGDKSAGALMMCLALIGAKVGDELMAIRRILEKRDRS